MNQEQSIRVLVVDDHTIVRRGIKALLTETDDIQVIGEAKNGAEAIQLSSQLEPDIILMDLLMPGMDGIQTTRQITGCQPWMKIIVLTSFVGDDKIFPALKAGAIGYVLKDSGPSELIHSIYKCFNGEPSISPNIARKILEEFDDVPLGRLTQERLTTKEMEVLRLLAQGFTNEEIAGQMLISVRTVSSYVSRLMEKLHLASRVQAALYALREGMAYMEYDIYPSNR
jgi:NarL family two-component system response regulator LiaR